MRYKTSGNGLCGFVSSYSVLSTIHEKRNVKVEKKKHGEVTKEMISKVDPLLKLSNGLLEICRLNTDTADDISFEVDFNLFMLFNRIKNTSHVLYTFNNMKNTC